ncbi:FAD-dependent oxidoreductase [Pseudomonas sp. NPDC089530]|uniref:FAD-dependent oxidoreductase n=1 Tax=Pseudomonas sp. NPDC089530 TaxID=3390651 RepID=UPI003D05846B
MNDWRVGIIGAGIGGLCLAQGLAKAGIAVEIHEIDSSAHSRGQGYRLRIDAVGQQALARCLTPANDQLWRASCPRMEQPARFIDPQLHPQEQRVPRHWAPGCAPVEDLCVHRQTLREVLCDGLEEHIHWHHPLHSFHPDGSGVELRFANASRRRVDLLVAADGVGSMIRRQLLPQATVHDSGAICLYGKTPLTAKVLHALEPQWLQGTSVVFADGFSLVIEPMRFNRDLALLPAQYGSNCRLSAVDDYLYWAFIGPGTRLAGKDLARTDSAAWQAHLRVLSADWHPQLRSVLEHGDASVLSVRTVYSASQVPDWPSGRVTLLGDAIHPMSPAGGLGANSALHDAALLADTLASVSCAQQLPAAVQRYEDAMRQHANQALQTTRLANQRLFDRS